MQSSDFLCYGGDGWPLMQDLHLVSLKGMYCCALQNNITKPHHYTSQKLIFPYLAYYLLSRKWILAAKAVVNTIVASFSGCVFAVFHTLYKTDGKVDVLMLINGILGALVGITASCALVTTVHAGKIYVVSSSILGMKINSNFSAFIGAVGAWLANITANLLIYLKVDDAVGATCVHGKF